MTARSPDPRLLKDLKAVRAAAPRPADELLYQYLERVYEFKRRWNPKDPRVWSWIKAQPRHHRMKLDIFRLIVDVTVGDHITAKMKHKYAAVLRCAFGQRIKVGDVTRFIKKHHGINAVIEKFYDP